MAIAGFIIVLTLGLLGVQIVLSLIKNKWLGLILPTMTFIFSIILTIVVYISNDVGNTYTSQIGEAGLIFVISNIPTVIFLLIYFVLQYFVHRNTNHKKQMDKMSIQDL